MLLAPQIADLVRSPLVVFRNATFGPIEVIDGSGELTFGRCHSICRRCRPG